MRYGAAATQAAGSHFARRNYMTSTESDVRALLERWSEAARTKDIDRLMSLYAPDIVYFDVVPPLRFSGPAAVRANFLRWFGGWKSEIGLDVRDMNIQAAGDVAAAYMLIRVSGTLQDGREVGYRVRATVCCRRSETGWVIVHEHVSLPVDVKSGRVVMDAVP
jgi:uncharacterized protein (TIGR02246 family)